MKNWNLPTFIHLTKDNINSGSPTEVRPGEFIAPLVGTACPWYGASCINAAYVVYTSMGENSSQAFCQTDSGGYLAYRFCS